MANQEKYIHSIVNNFMKLLCDILTIFVIVKFRSLESIAILILIIKIIEEIVMRIVVKKRYNWLEEVSNRNTSMAKMTKDLIWSQVGYLVLNNVDAVLIMFFIGPVAVSIYTSYNFILRYLEEITSRVNWASVSSFGNVFAKKEAKRAYSLFKELQALFIIISISTCLTFAIGIRSFIMVWIKDINYILSYKTVFLFTMSLFMIVIYYPLLSIIDANGLFKDNKKHTLLCALTNVVLSIILIQFYKIDGVLIGTIIAFVLNIFLKCRLLKTKIFKNISLLKFLSPYILATLAFVILGYLVMYIEPYLLFNINNIFICIVVLGLIFIFTTTLTFTIMYMISPYVVNLVERLKNLIKHPKISNK